VAAASADGVVVQRNLILLNYHPASQSLGTPPKQGGEFCVSSPVNLAFRNKDKTFSDRIRITVRIRGACLI